VTAITDGRPRRTQAERRAASRSRLLDAALDCLAERGYAGTTFPEVLRRAGLSNGALWRHFRSKAELMVAASLHSEEQLINHPVPAGLDHLSPQQRLDSAVAELWTWIHQPAFQAMLELLRASRSDPELARQMTLSDERSAELFFAAVAARVGPQLAGRSDFQRNARLLGLALYGVGLTTGLRQAAAERRLLAEMQQLARALFR
jgi:AcrR family transcriptional regulator